MRDALFFVTALSAALGLVFMVPAMESYIVTAGDMGADDTTLWMLRIGVIIVGLLAAGLSVLGFLRFVPEDEP